MERLIKFVEREGAYEEFGLDCHDLSLENVFVDEVDHTKIVRLPCLPCKHLSIFLHLIGLRRALLIGSQLRPDRFGIVPTFQHLFNPHL